MESKKYNLIRVMYLTKRVTAAEVWEKMDTGDITEEEAVKICGPRPKK